MDNVETTGERLFKYSSSEVETFYYRFDSELDRHRMLSIWKTSERYAGHQTYNNSIEGRTYYFVIMDYLTSTRKVKPQTFKPSN